jgi:hypothetical protein
MRSPPLVPAFDFETCIVLDDFGGFRVYRETDENEVDRETIIRNIINGQYEKPVRVVAFNTAEGWSMWDVRSYSGQRAPVNRCRSRRSHSWNGRRARTCQRGRQ